uniref:NEDD8-activating enzyme E1 regulatory subunit n=1 Tax=Schistocephalus solidus TaxID=70667 RepID=A0A0X3PUH9_SCHSO
MTVTTISQAKEQRYDRQLRLWGDRGQEVLEGVRICVIRASAVGSELLKNLVLPGVGNFTIVDSALVTESDLGNNFFVTKAYLGKPRAQAVTELISELNQGVKGAFVVETVDELLDNDPGFFLNFSVIVYTDVRESQLLRLSRIVSPARIPIVICNSTGFLGYLRVSVLEHAIIESHPDSTRPDFRLDRPLPALVKLANQPDHDLDTLPAKELAHIPWLIIIHKFVEQFRTSHGRFPTTYADKQELKKMIGLAASDLLEKCQARGETLEPFFELTNFQEACRAVNTAVIETKIPPDVAQIFDDCPGSLPVEGTFNSCSNENVSARTQHASITTSPLCGSSSKTASSPLANLTMPTFWRLVTALRDFTLHEGDGCLPLRGDLPDMTSDSSRYLRLLSVFREQAEWAVSRLAARLSDVEGLTLEDVRVLARNAAYLKVIRCRSLEEVLKLSPVRSEDLYLLPTHEENDSMVWYFVLRGAASFVAEEGRWPGSGTHCGGGAAGSAAGRAEKVARLRDGENAGEAAARGDSLTADQLVEMDLPLLRAHVNRILRASGLAINSVSDDYVYEMCRFGGGEVHSIAAFMGGIAAQEVIKLATHQFVPLSQPLIYNGITQRTEVLEF